MVASFQRGMSCRRPIQIIANVVAKAAIKTLFSLGKNIWSQPTSAASAADTLTPPMCIMTRRLFPALMPVFKADTVKFDPTHTIACVNIWLFCSRRNGNLKGKPHMCVRRQTDRRLAAKKLSMISSLLLPPLVQFQNWGHH